MTVFDDCCAMFFTMASSKSSSRFHQRSRNAARLSEQQPRGAIRGAKHSATVQPSSWMDNRWLHISILLAAVGAVFGRVLSFDFIRLDDSSLLMAWGNYYFEASSIIKAFTSFTTQDFYRPLTQVVFILGSLIGGGKPWAYHIAPLLFHCASVVAVYVFLVRVGRSLQYPPRVAFLLALIFALHPVYAASVAWIGAFSESLLVMLAIPSFLLFLRFYEHGSRSALIAHGILFLAAFWARETAILLPVLCVGFLWAEAASGTIGLSTVHSAQEEHKRLHSTDTGKFDSDASQSFLARLLVQHRFRLACGLWVFVALVWFGMRTFVMAQAPTKTAGYNPNYIGLTALWLNLRTLSELCGKMLLPLNLAVFPRYSVFSTALGSVVLLLFAGSVVWLKFAAAPRHWRFYVFGVVWAVGALVPTLLVRAVTARYDYFDQRVYLSVIGLMLSLGSLLVMLAGKRSSQQALSRAGGIVLTSLPLPVTLAGVVLVVIFGGMSYRQSGFFQNPSTFWEEAVRNAPELAETHFHHGYNLLLQERYHEAEEQLAICVRLDSSKSSGFAKLAIAKYELGKSAAYEESKRLFEKALSLNPKDDDALVGLVILNIQEKHFEEALRCNEALERAGFVLTNFRPDAAQVLANYKKMKAEGSIQPQ